MGALGVRVVFVVFSALVVLVVLVAFGVLDGFTVVVVFGFTVLVVFGFTALVVLALAAFGFVDLGVVLERTVWLAVVVVLVLDVV